MVSECILQVALFAYLSAEWEREVSRHQKTKEQPTSLAVDHQSVLSRDSWIVIMTQ